MGLPQLSTGKASCALLCTGTHGYLLVLHCDVSDMTAVVANECDHPSREMSRLQPCAGMGVGTSVLMPGHACHLKLFADVAPAVLLMA